MNRGFFVKFLGRWIVATIAIYLVQLILPGLHIDDFATAILAGLALGFLNAFVRPIIIFLTLPATIFSLGLFILVINALMLYLVGVMEIMQVDSFGWAFLGALLISIISSVLNGLIFPEDRKVRVEIRRHK